LPALAARRVRWKIDAALRSRKPLPPGPDHQSSLDLS
jgi:hypothetical protein